MIPIGFKTDPRRPINVMDEVTSALSVGDRGANAREAVGYLAEALGRVGRWEAEIVRTDRSSASVSSNLTNGESGAVSAERSGEDWLLHCDLARARARRRPYAPSWVFNRLYELATHSSATVWLWEVPFDDRRARGRTRVWSRTEDGSGRASGVQIFVNSNGSALDKGFTLLHEVCVHAWRLIRYGDSRATANHFGRTTRHWGAYHVEFDEHGYHSHQHSSHSLADHEADLLQFIREGRPPRRPELGSQANRQHDRAVRATLDRIRSARRRTLNGQCLSNEARAWRLYSPSRVGESMRRCGPQGTP